MTSLLLMIDSGGYWHCWLLVLFDLTFSYLSHSTMSRRSDGDDYITGGFIVTFIPPFSVTPVPYWDDSVLLKHLTWLLDVTHIIDYWWRNGLIVKCEPIITLIQLLITEFLFIVVAYLLCILGGIVVGDIIVGGWLYDPIEGKLWFIVGILLAFYCSSYSNSYCYDWSLLLLWMTRNIIVILWRLKIEVLWGLLCVINDIGMMCISIVLSNWLTPLCVTIAPLR